LQLESWVHREQAILVKFDRYGRQSGRSGGASGKAVGHPDGSLDLALIAWSAHVIRAEVAQVDDPSKHQKQAYPDDVAQVDPARMPRLHRKPLVA